MTDDAIIAADGNRRNEGFRKIHQNALKIIGCRKTTNTSYFNEEQLGNAVRHSGIKREEFFIATKLWVQDYEVEDALRAFELSMRKLRLEYIDLYLLHKPYGNYYAAWRVCEKLYKEVKKIATEINNFLNEENSDERKQI